MDPQSSAVKLLSKCYRIKEGLKQTIKITFPEPLIDLKMMQWIKGTTKTWPPNKEQNWENKEHNVFFFANLGLFGVW